MSKNKNPRDDKASENACADFCYMLCCYTDGLSAPGFVDFIFGASHKKITDIDVTSETVPPLEQLPMQRDSP